jgi:glycosyltransferase involved in cell wall biosynthesis
MKSEKVLAVIPGQESGQEFIFARRQIAQMLDFGLAVQPFFLDTRTDLFDILKNALRFRKAIRNFDPSVVHAHYGTVTALFAICFSRKPVVVSFKGTDLNPSSEFSWFRGATSRVFSQIAALFAAEIICVSEELKGRLWWRKKRAEIIIDGVNLHEFFPIDRQEARKKLQWGRDDRIVLFNNGADQPPNKGRDLVDKAIELLRSKLDLVELIVMKGDVPGSVVPLYINAADVVVMASEFEGSPNIVKEALACNVPVCSVFVGDVPQLLAGVENCQLVERTPSAMADGLYNLINEPVRSNGRDFADRFSAQLNTARVCAVLKTAAGKSIRS